MKGRKKTPRASERKVEISHLGRHEPPPLREEIFVSWQLHLENRFRDGVVPKIDKQGVHRINAPVSQFASAALLVHASQIFFRRFAADSDVDFRPHVGVVRDLIVFAFRQSVFL